MARFVALVYLFYPSIATLFHTALQLSSWAIFILISGAGIEAIYSYSVSYKEIIDWIGDLCGKLWSHVVAFCTSSVCGMCGKCSTELRNCGPSAVGNIRAWWTGGRRARVQEGPTQTMDV
jgi:hypothetical protein